MSNGSQIVGKRAVYEAVSAGVPIYELAVANNINKDKLISNIFRIARNSNICIKQLDQKQIEKMSNTPAHQGIIAKTKSYNYSSVREILDFTAGKESSLLIVCDHITDTHNFGAIIRSAESVGCDGIVIPNARSVEVNSTVYKTSAGAALHLRIAQVPNIARVLEELKSSGYWVCGATEHADTSIWDSDLKGRICVVLGNEERGLSDIVLKNIDFSCSLPQMGKISSLNVAQASTVFMYEWLRQNR